ncbi:hypothetical protein LSAT2_002084 [Lamellibrachia satsuma]|nr:hypothetical protein LSAT2_002084 [Lamellibrachia satsuma]
MDKGPHVDDPHVSWLYRQPHPITTLTTQDIPGRPTDHVHNSTTVMQNERKFTTTRGAAYNVHVHGQISGPASSQPLPRLQPPSTTTSVAQPGSQPLPRLQPPHTTTSDTCNYYNNVQLLHLLV